jgi:hypothetical protein
VAPKKSAESTSKKKTKKPANKAASSAGGKNKLTAAEKRQRDAEVVRLRLQPMTWTDVAKSVGLGVVQCQRIWKAFQESAKSEIEGLDAVDWVVETFEFHEGVIQRLGAIAADETAQHSARVGAITAQRSAKAEQTALLQATGFLATDLGKVKQDVTLREILQELLAVFDEMGVPAEVEERLFERLQPKVGKRLSLPVAGTR